MAREHFLFTEIYRPKKVDDCILPSRLKEPFKSYVEKQEIPNLLLSGPPGVGKTTVAKAMCEEIGCSYLFINSSLERGIDTLRMKIQTYASTMSLNGKRKVIIMDEADNLTNDAQSALRGTIEEFSKNCTFILTCNFKAKIMDAIAKSRCVQVDFTLRDDEKMEMQGQFFVRLKKILKERQIEFDPKVLVAIVLKYAPDYRQILGHIQHMSQSGKIDAGALAQLETMGDVKTLFEHLKSKEFPKVREWVSKNTDVDTATLFKALYDSLDTHLNKISIPQAILILAKYQYQAAFVADQEINILACLTEIMLECDFA